MPAIAALEPILRNARAWEQVIELLELRLAVEDAVEQRLALLGEIARIQELERRDIDAAVALFEPDSYWRDLVAFTWNIKTVEGPAGVKDMLEHTLSNVKPRGWHTFEPPAEADGITEAWIEFETEAGRGRGHLRLRDGKAWTLLTTLYELKGHEEPAGFNRPMGAEHGADPERRTWLEKREREAAERAAETAAREAAELAMQETDLAADMSDDDGDDDEDRKDKKKKKRKDKK